MNIKDAEVFLVGSMVVPSDTVDEAMGLAADLIGGQLCAIPDGEVGPRLMWAPGAGGRAFENHPDFVVDEAAAGSESIIGLIGRYRLKPGVTEVSLDGRFDYADSAISSYRHLLQMRERGEAPDDIRFQVSLPTPMPVVAPWFGDPADWPVMYSAVWRALHVELARILEVIPANELAISWDYCTEICELVDLTYGHNDCRTTLGMTWMPERSYDEALAAHTAPEYIEPMSHGVPDEVVLGYHFCLGTAPPKGFPSTPIEDLAPVVRVANIVVERTPHRVDYIHLPAMADSNREFFAPLADLRVGDARVFLGIEQRDGVERLVERGRAAQEFLPSFGISHWCGYGREVAGELPKLLSDLHEGANQLNS